MTALLVVSACLPAASLHFSLLPPLHLPLFHWTENMATTLQRTHIGTNQTGHHPPGPWCRKITRLNNCNQFLLFMAASKMSPQLATALADTDHCSWWKVRLGSCLLLVTLSSMKQSITLFHICLCSGFLSFAVIKYPDHRNLEEERVYLAYNSRFQSITETKSKQKSWKLVTSHP